MLTTSPQTMITIRLTMSPKTMIMIHLITIRVIMIQAEATSVFHIAAPNKVS